jgi:hypothetical protein
MTPSAQAKAPVLPVQRVMTFEKASKRLPIDMLFARLAMARIIAVR